MKPSMRISLLGLGLGALASPSVAQSEYTVTDLGVLPGHILSDAAGINELGQVVGSSYDVVNNERHAFLWEGGVMTDLGTLPGGQFAFGYAINDTGQIAGKSDTFDGVSSVTYGYLLDGSMSALTTLPDRTTRGNDLNAAGTVVGTALFDFFLPTQAAVWSGGPAINLGGLMPDGGSEAFGINDGGSIVGKATVFDGLSFWHHAFLWDGVSMTDLGSFGNGSEFAAANDVNDAGQVVGYAENRALFYSHAFLWDSGTLTDLGVLTALNSEARAINGPGQIVGWSNSGHLHSHATLWEGGNLYDLNDLIVPFPHDWHLVVAEDINDAGQIVGYGYAPGFPNLHAFLLDPIDAVDPFCFGDAGTCPCGNGGALGSGCDIAQGTGGVKLEPTVYMPDFVGGGMATLTATGFPPAAAPTAVGIRSTTRETPPVTFGDGLRCIGVPVVRIGATAATGGVSTHSVMHGAGAGTFHYQIWFRNTPSTFCSPLPFNLSNGLTLSWP